MQPESLTHKPPYWDQQPCPYCGGVVKYASNAAIYSGRVYGNGKCYYCTKCYASCGVHSEPHRPKIGSRRPLGLLATQPMKDKKTIAHALFDVIWRNQQLVKRPKLYKKLAKKLDIPTNQCHFGWFNEERLSQAIKIMSEPNWFN